MKNVETTNEDILKEVKLQASNIDEEGNVLYLDDQRLERKKIGFKRYKRPGNGLGIKNFILEHFVHMTDKRWGIARWLYNFFMKFAHWLKEGGLKGKLYKKFIKLDPHMERNTAALVMPLNVDITDKGQKVEIPIDMLKETLKKVKFIGGMDTCLCRESNGCQDYPHDLGCLFLGEAGRIVTKHNLGRELTYEEACERVDRAASLGLRAQAVWIEFEQVLWGVRNDLMDDFLEVCFCCPCCCIAMRLPRQLSDIEHQRFHPSGWTAVADRTKCIGCGMCIDSEKGCPVDAIKIADDGKVSINQEKCVGCGICRDRCKLDVISIKQTMPMREDIVEYFDKEFNIGLDKVYKEEYRNNGNE